MIAIVGTVGVPACYGGFETLVENLLDDMEECTVYCSGKSYGDKLDEYKSAKLVYLPFSANGLSSILYDALSMIDAVLKRNKVILVLGVSAGIIIPLLRLFTACKFVTNIDGLEWRRDKWNFVAKWYLKFSERAAVKFSHAVIADNKGIADYVYSEYGINARTIAYGGDHALISKVSKCNEEYALGVCRIEPENNVHLILEAFKNTSCVLKFVGNWSSSAYGVSLKERFSDVENIILIDPVYDLKELFKLREACKFFVHGHSAGGTNPSLVEAMFFCKPIVAFDCIYNRYTLNDKGFYFSDVLSLRDTVIQLQNSDVFICAKEIESVAYKKYTWTHIRQEYLSLLNNFDH